MRSTNGPRQRGKIMTAKTQDPAAVAREIVLTSQKSVSQAVAMADRAAARFPEYRFPASQPGQPTPSFADVAAHLRTLLPAQEPAVRVEESAPVKAAPAKRAARKAAPVKAAPVKVAEPAPVTVVTTTLKLVHDGVKQTSIFGTEKGSRAAQILGRNGLGWKFWGAGECWYLMGSQGYAPDMGTINEAVAALESAEEDGVKLYRVETDIRDTDADGVKLPVKMSKAQAAQWQRAYTARDQSINWNLSVGRGVCDGCGASGLTLDTGRKARDGQNLPILQCGTCGGFGAPQAEVPAEVSVSADDLLIKFAAPLLALPAAPVKAETPAEETAECPACKTVRKVVGGRFELHTSALGNGACRGKVGEPVADVEPEAAPAPARKAAARKATAADMGVVVTPAENGMMVKFAIQGGLSMTSAKELTTDLRRTLDRMITRRGQFKGVKFSCFLDKAERKFVRVEIVEGAEGHDTAALDAEIERVAKSVRGIKNRMHKG